RHLESATLMDAIRSWLLGLLSKRMYSRFQLEKKCREAGYEPKVISEILQEFEERNWINDREFAFAFSRDKMRFQKWGPKKIKMHLLVAEIAENIDMNAISGTISREAQHEIAKKLIDKKKRSF